MDEEELEQELPQKPDKKKIDVGAFFDRLNQVDEVANTALKKSESNLSAINANKTLINSISVSIEAMKTEIRDIANYIIVERKIEKDEKKDKELEEQDRRQKQQMTERATQGAQGPQGPKGNDGQPTDEKQGGGFFAGLGKLIGGLGLIAGLAVLATTLAPIILPVMIGGIIVATIAAFRKPIGNAIRSIGKKLGIGIGDTSKKTIGRVPLIGGRVNDMASKLGGALEEKTDNIAKSLEGQLDSAGGGGGTGQTSGSNLAITGAEGGADEVVQAITDSADKAEESQTKDEIESKTEDKKDDLKSDNETDESTKEELEPTPKERRGFLSLLGGAADALTGGRTDFDGMGDGGMVDPRSSKPNVPTRGVTPRNTPQVSAAELKPTTTLVPFVRTISNQYLSVKSANLPPEVARMIQ